MRISVLNTGHATPNGGRGEGLICDSSHYFCSSHIQYAYVYFLSAAKLPSASNYFVQLSIFMMPAMQTCVGGNFLLSTTANHTHPTPLDEGALNSQSLHVAVS